MLLTVATPGVADTQGLDTAAVAVPVNYVVAPTQAVNVPPIVGRVFTFT